MKKLKVFICIIVAAAIGVGSFFVIKGMRKPSEAEMYAMLNSHMVSIANNEVNSLTLEKEKTEYSTHKKTEEILEDRTFFANAPDPYGQIEDMSKKANNENGTGKKDKVDIGYTLEAGEGYIENYSKSENIGNCVDSNEALNKIGVIADEHLLQADYTVKSNDKIINYVRPANATIGTDTYGEYVGVDNALKYSKSLIQNVEIVNLIKNNLTLDEYKEDVVQFCEDLINQSIEYSVVLNPVDCEMSCTLSAEDKNYVLTTNLVSNDTLEIIVTDRTDDDDEILWLNIQLQLKVVFNKSGIVQYEYIVTCDEKYHSPIQVFYNTDGVSLGITTLEFWYDRVINCNMNFDYGLKNSSKVNSANYADFDNEITQRKVNITYYGDGVEIGTDNLDSGSSFTAKTYLSDRYITGWYLDAECTKPFNSTEFSTVPSNDLNLYCKSLVSKVIILIRYTDEATTDEIYVNEIVFEAEQLPLTLSSTFVDNSLPTGYSVKTYNSAALIINNNGINVIQVICRQITT